MLNQKPYIYFLLLTVVLFISWIAFKILDLTFVFNVVDTYNVISYSDIVVLILVPAVIVSFLYKLFDSTKIKLVKSLSKIHTLITILSTLLFILILSLFDFISPLGTNSRFPLFDDSNGGESTLFILLLILVFSQLLFIINLLISLFKHFLKRN